MLTVQGACAVTRPASAANVSNASANIVVLSRSSPSLVRHPYMLLQTPVAPQIP
jgi:hypothetical protein